MADLKVVPIAAAANDAPYVRPMTPLEASCPLCFGSGALGTAEPYPCNCRRPVEAATIRKMLMRLTVEQMAFLRRFEHTLADQPVTAEEYGSPSVEFFVEDDDAVINDDYDAILIPATQHWFAGSKMGGGPQHEGWKYWIHYNPNGLALREALMAGATAQCR